jgi:hypothetical protein
VAHFEVAMHRVSRFAAVLLFFAATTACALHNPRIADLQMNPGRYQDRSVNIEGVVTTSWGIPLAPFRMYKVDDGTGEVTVLSQGSRTPTKGARVRVKGKVEDIAVLGGQPVGLHIREQNLKVNR